MTICLPWLLVLVSTAAAFAGEDQNWPQFRGPDMTGVSDNAELPLEWSASENVEWTTDLPGRGWSSPVVWGNRIFLTTVINEEKSEEPKKGLYFGGNRPQPPGSVHKWVVLCLSIDKGEVLWTRTVHEGPPETAIHLKNSFASETPVTDGKYIYALFGNLGLFCFDFEGDLKWEKRIEPQETRYGWGTAASPVVHLGRLYIVNDNEEDSWLMAVDCESGDELWKVSRDEKSNWSTPFIWENDQRTEIVTPGTQQVRSYSLDGELLWHLKGMSSITIATPYIYDGMLIISSGYVGDRASRPIYAILPGASGDISLAEDEDSNEWIKWCRKMDAPYNPTTIVVDDELIVLYDFGLLASFDADDGSTRAAKQRISGGRAFTASPWAYREHVFFLNEDGVTFVYKPGDSLELVRKNALQENEMAMATPAIAGDRLLIRTDARLYCIRDSSR